MFPVKHLSLLVLSGALLSACSSQMHDDQLNREASTSQITVEGVPGGVTTEMVQINAVVSAIDYAKRNFTVEDEQGHRRTFYASPEMVNFPQLKVGDKVNATVVLEEVVFLREPSDESQDGAAGVLATTPTGAKPGMLRLETLEMTAMVKAIDTTQHTATLEFADGSRKTIKVRPDVQIKPEYLNRQVVIRLTEALAIRVKTL